MLTACWRIISGIAWLEHLAAVLSVRCLCLWASSIGPSRHVLLAVLVGHIFLFPREFCRKKVRSGANRAAGVSRSGLAVGPDVHFLPQEGTFLSFISCTFLSRLGVNCIVVVVSSQSL